MFSSADFLSNLFFTPVVVLDAYIITELLVTLRRPKQWQIWSTVAMALALAGFAWSDSNPMRPLYYLCCLLPPLRFIFALINPSRNKFYMTALGLMSIPALLGLSILTFNLSFSLADWINDSGVPDRSGHK